MKRFFFGLLLVSAAFLQASLLPRLNPIEITPNLVLVLLFLWAGLRGTREGLVWAFFGGLLLDVLSVQTLGVNGIPLAAVVLVAGPAQNRMFRSNVVFSIALVALATVIYSLMTYAIRDVSPTIQILGQAALHAVIVPIAWLMIRYIDSR